MNKLVFSDYEQLFSTEGMAFITSDIFMDFYKTLGVVTTFANNKWTSYMPKSSITLTSEEGIKLFKNKELFNKYSEDIEEYYKRTELFFEELLKKEHFTLDETREAFDLMTENFKYYSKTEFFYIDEAFKLVDSDNTVKEHFQRFEEIKNSSRVKMNKLLFEPKGCRKTLVKKLSVQFDIPYEDISMYGKKELLKLFEGGKLDKTTVDDRNFSYLMIGRGDNIEYHSGKESKEIIDDFASKSNSSNGELKGIIAHKGKVTSVAYVIKYGDNAFARMHEIIEGMPEGAVLIADTTSPELVMACRKAAAILTNQGGMMSHAAIISRELKIPCIVGLKTVTDKVKSGDMVEVDADKGIVRIFTK